MRHILKFALIAVSIACASPAFAACKGVGCFGNGSGNGNGGGQSGNYGGNNGSGNNHHWHKGSGNGGNYGNNHHWHKGSGNGGNYGGNNLHWHNGSGNGGNSGDYSDGGGTWYDNDRPRRWRRQSYNDDGVAEVFTGIAAFTGGLTVGSLLNQPAPPPEDPPPPRIVYVEPAPGLNVFPEAPKLKAAPVAPASKQKVTNRKKTTNKGKDKPTVTANAKAASPTTINNYNNLTIVTKDGTSPAITTDIDGNAVPAPTLEEVCRTKNGNYYLGADGLPKCDL